LAPDSDTAAVVRRIFDQFISGKGLYVIAEELTREGIACPSARDPARNRHRSGIAWSKSAIRAILTNPRYTGRQVWNRQRSDEVLLDVKDVAMGHTTVQRWNAEPQWIKSDALAHAPLVDDDIFERAQKLLRTNPRNVIMREDALVAPLDSWIARLFDPEHRRSTVAAMAATEEPEPSPHDYRTISSLADCDQKLAQYRRALDTGADPAVVTGWINETHTEKLASSVNSAPRSPRQELPRQ
jgi:hypothetical protein